MLLPRQVAAVSGATVNISAAAVEPSEERAETEPAAGNQEDPTRLARILFQLETCLSDWGLAHAPQWLARLNENGFLELDDILQLPSIQQLATSSDEITRAFQEKASQTLELDSEGKKIKRKHTPRDDPAQADWESQTIYIENLPPFSFFDTLPAEVRDWTAVLLGCDVEALVFPLLSNQDEREAPPMPSVYLNTMDYSKNASPNDKNKKKRLKCPHGGGIFKNFAVAILSSSKAAEQAAVDWSWDRNLSLQSEEASIGADADLSKETEQAKAVEAAHKFGLKVMSIYQWHTLRAEYLQYQRRLKDLEAKDERSRTTRYESDKRRDSGRSRKRERPADEEVAKDRHRSDWRSARDQTFASEEAAYKEMAEANFPEACVVRLANIHPEASFSTVRKLAQSMVKLGGGADTDSVVNVESPKEGIALVRMSAPGAAVAIKMYLMDEKLFMGEANADSVEKLSSTIVGELEPITAEIATGEEERAFWSRVPVTSRRKERPFNSRDYHSQSRPNYSRKSRRIDL